MMMGNDNPYPHFFTITLPRCQKRKKGGGFAQSVVMIACRGLRRRAFWSSISSSIYTSQINQILSIIVGRCFKMSGIEKSPLARLVLFMVCLSIAGSFVAGAHYYVIDVPQQKALSGYPPANANTDTAEKCNTCMNGCVHSGKYNYWECKLYCEIIC